jgi:hypothetical protein
MGVYTQEIPASHRHRLRGGGKTGFKTGEGIPYEMYPGFYRFMTELADAKHRQVLVDKFLPSVEQGDGCQKIEERHIRL